MARSSNNGSSQGSQFFIVYKNSTIPSDTAGGYTVIGKVTSGLDQLITQVADKGVQGGGTDGKPVVTTTINGISVQ
jgi:peptidyl-prolyl cis-trans isomerase B (cyclophilin B)